MSGPLVGGMLVLLIDILGIQFERHFFVWESICGPRMDNETSSDGVASIVVFTIDEYNGHVPDIVGVLHWPFMQVGFAREAA